MPYQACVSVSRYLNRRIELIPARDAGERVAFIISAHQILDTSPGRKVSDRFRVAWELQDGSYIQYSIKRERFEYIRKYQFDRIKLDADLIDQFTPPP